MVTTSDPELPATEDENKKRDIVIHRRIKRTTHPNTTHDDKR